MLQGDSPTTANNKDISVDEKYAISNVFKEKNYYEEEKNTINIPNEREINKKTLGNKKDLKIKNEVPKNVKLHILNKNNNENNYQGFIDNPHYNSNNNQNYNSSYILKEQQNLKNIFEQINFSNNKLQNYKNANNEFINQRNTNEQQQNMKNIKNKKQKKTKRVKFKNQFLDIVEIESFKSFNANMCYSDLEFVDTAERKSLCKELCTIL